MGSPSCKAARWRVSPGWLPQGVGSIQGLPRLDHHTHADGEPHLDRRDDAGPALDLIGEGRILKCSGARTRIFSRRSPRWRPSVKIESVDSRVQRTTEGGSQYAVTSGMRSSSDSAQGRAPPRMGLVLTSYRSDQLPEDLGLGPVNGSIHPGREPARAPGVPACGAVRRTGPAPRAAAALAAQVCSGAVAVAVSVAERPSGLHPGCDTAPPGGRRRTGLGPPACCVPIPAQVARLLAAFEVAARATAV